MAQVVEVGLNVDADGAVRSVEATGASFRDLAEAADVAGSEADEAMNRTGRAANNAARDTDGAARSMRRLSNASDDVARSGGNATQILFSAGDAVQDVQFGFAGAANNIAFMAEQFVTLSTQTGGARAALSAVGSSLLGVGGVIFAFNALLALAPQIIAFFDDTEEGAKDADDTLKSLASSLIDVGGDLPEFESIPAERAQVLFDRLNRRLQTMTGFEKFGQEVEGTISEMERLAQALEVLEAEDQDRGRFSTAEIRAKSTRNELAEALNLQGATAEEARRALQAERERARLLRGVVGVLKEQGAQTEDQTRLVEFLKDLGFEVKENAEDEADAVERTTRARGVQAIRLKGLSERLEDARRRAERMRDLIDEIERREPRTLEEMSADVELAPAPDMPDAADEQERLNEQLGITRDLVTDSLIGGFQEMGRAIGEGQSALAAFGRAAANILASITRAIGQQLIAQGTALVASALLPGQQGNAAAGAAYIAAGGTLIASAGALSSIGGGGGGASGSRSGPQLERGGEAEVNVPGRRNGGPVGAGQLYETHGLGDREFFMPAIDGAIMTQTQMDAMRQRMDVQFQFEDMQADFDFFKLNARLNEVERTLTRVARP